MVSHIQGQRQCRGAASKGKISIFVVKNSFQLDFFTVVFLIFAVILSGKNYDSPQNKGNYLSSILCNWLGIKVVKTFMMSYELSLLLGHFLFSIERKGGLREANTGITSFSRPYALSWSNYWSGDKIKRSDIVIIGVARIISWGGHRLVRLLAPFTVFLAPYCLNFSDVDNMPLTFFFAHPCVLVLVICN